VTKEIFIFSEHIADRLIDFKFNVSTNPFGIIFNPKSIAGALKRILHKKYFNDQDVFEKEGLWYSLDTHSSISAKSKNEFLEKINQLIDLWHLQIHHASYLIVTFGSAFGYKNKIQDKIVANCHKLPQSEFEKILLENHEIIVDFQELIDVLKVINPSLLFHRLSI
jgi:hypothetical protein